MSQSQENDKSDLETSSLEETPQQADKGTNPYAYLDRDEFSSERFKIEIKNLPRFYGINELKRLLNDKLNLGSNKIKTPKRNSPYIFVTFRSNEDREKAIEVINKFKWKGKTLIAHKAKPAPDPLVKKRKEEQEDDNVNKKLKVDDRPQEERLKSSTIPLWNVPYEDQLKMKQQNIRQILVKLGNNLLHFNPHLKEWINKQKAHCDDLICEMLDVRHSDIYNGYRNKCEFTVGLDEETRLPTVGFRIGSYSVGLTGVAPVDNLSHIPDSMKKAVQLFQEFVRSSKLKVFDPELQTGNFRQLTVRCASDQLMLIVGTHPQNLNEEQLTDFKKDLITFFSEGAGKQAHVTSLYYQAIVKKKSRDDVLLPEHLYGETHIYENLLGLKFRISPEAFFQINTLGAEILYKSAIELAQPQKNTTVVDICCGTGTIGLCFAKTCDQVLGIEVVPQAVIDAKENAKINDIKNCEFFAGKAEDILGSVLYRTKNEDIITIVDPPRAGLHQKVIFQLRKTKKIKKLIYISCDPAAAMKNFIDLGRPESKTMHGEPFVPIKAIPVDMFPHTKHCELIIYFERFLQDQQKEMVDKEEKVKDVLIESTKLQKLENGEGKSELEEQQEEMAEKEEEAESMLTESTELQELENGDKK